MGINSGKNKFNVVYTDSRDYPQPPKFNETHSFTLDTKLLSNIIKKTSFAACQDKTRIHLAGLNFRVMQNILHVAGTDSRRLSYIKVPVQSDKECQFTVPLETLKQVKMLCYKYDKVDIVLTDDENQIVFRFEGVVYYSRLLNDEFPDYLSIIPADFQTRVIVGKENLKDILRMAKPVASASSIKALSTKVEESQLYIEAQAEEQGQFKTSLEVDKQGDNTDINFNIDYFYQVLEVLGEEVLAIDFNGPARPTAVREKDNDDFVYIVMPIRG
ncbi:MAG: DNA polymerase III subunit beta [Candidatus Muiribacterium halophilum]|uniref:DNA polymerase III subunit beta n=1 Tax=Muiribacterium halophilum TaxID=2053465 RepID=A0A2N5ZH88_MUIH1|nr:MAG: DNA polymerase III subunit beta [Candidatus Muirbacterium halophilum]